MDSRLNLPNGEQINVFEATLNTAVAIGSDPIRLLAKLHGQCEIHAYVERQNRAWLANIIEEGITNKILRVWEDNQYGGWPAVIELLRSRDDEPVVTSYSVTDQFPNRWSAGDFWAPPSDLSTIRQLYDLTEDEDLTEWIAQYTNDLWYELNETEKWHFAMKGLRKSNETQHLEIEPETFASQGYGNGKSAFDIWIP